MIVREHMSTPVISVRPDSDYMAALRTMQDQHLHHLPVIDAQGELIGILAERDLLVAAGNYPRSAVEVTEVMHRNVVTVNATTSLAEAASLMVRHSIGGLPVVDEGNHVVGIITEKDVFRAFVSMLEAGEAVKPL